MSRNGEDGMIELLVFDAGRTLGEFSGCRTHRYVAERSPLALSVIAEECRRFLHTNPLPDREVLEGFCHAVHVDVDVLPPHWVTGEVPQAPHEHASGFEPYPGAADAVNRMIEITGAPAVVLSNLPATTGPSQMAALRERFPMIQATYTSYGLRRRKPDVRLWQDIGDD
ncbi:MAG TPA: hypothetical protein VGL02_29105, partial [Streptomyces sp.]